VGTDATVVIEVAEGDRWVERGSVYLDRDYALFSLISEIRWAGALVVPERPGEIVWPGATEPDPESTWLWPDEVEKVLDHHEANGGKDAAPLRDALAAARGAYRSTSCPYAATSPARAAITVVVSISPSSWIPRTRGGAPGLPAPDRPVRGRSAPTTLPPTREAE
jgi:hypothetical protein